jgi:putative acetyltransferase
LAIAEVTERIDAGFMLNLRRDKEKTELKPAGILTPAAPAGVADPIARPVPCVTGHVTDPQANSAEELAENFIYLLALRCQTGRMKIQQLTIENRPRVYALLRLAFPHAEAKAEMVEKLHENGRPLHEWVCLHAGRIVAYIVFSNAYDGEVCGLHLGPMAVAPEFQRQGVGTELVRFVLRQEEIKSQPLFVLGKPGYFSRFGFAPCSQPICPFDKNNNYFLSMGNASPTPFIVGYEPEFKPAPAPVPAPKGKQRRVR